MDKLEEKIIFLFESGNQITINLAFELAKGQNLDIDAFLKKRYGNLLVYYDDMTQNVANLFNQKKIEFTYSAITFLPEGIGDLPKLESLSLRGNRIPKLPIALKRLISLKILDLDTTNFQVDSVVWEITSLEELSLGGNALKTIPKEIENLQNLKLLALNYNELSEFPMEVLALKNLETLLIGNNQLRKIPSEIAQLTNLKELSISRNLFEEFPKEVLALKNTCIRHS